MRVTDPISVTETQQYSSIMIYSLLVREWYKENKYHSENMCVVATTRPMPNSVITSKSHRRYIQQRTQVVYLQENLTENHNSILPTIYIFIYGPYYDCASYSNIHALSSCPLLIYLMSYYLSTIHLPQDQHVIYMCSDIIP